MKRTAKQYARDIRAAAEELVGLVNAARKDEDVEMQVVLDVWGKDDQTVDLGIGVDVTQVL